VIVNQLLQYGVHQYWCCCGFLEWNEHCVLDQSINYSQYTVELHSHAESFDVSNFVMKFIVTDSHDASSVFSCVISSYLLSLWILFLQHELHLMMYSVIWSLRSLILCLLCMRFSVLLTSRCSLALLLWHTCISSSSVKGVCFTLYVAIKPFVRIPLLSSLRISVWIFSLLHGQTVYLKRLLHHSHYSSCNEFEICNWLTVWPSKPVVDSTVLLLQSFSNSCDLCRSE
jgi:hypothetical protein